MAHLIDGEAEAASGASGDEAEDDVPTAEDLAFIADDDEEEEVAPKKKPRMKRVVSSQEDEPKPKQRKAPVALKLEEGQRFALTFSAESTRVFSLLLDITNENLVNFNVAADTVEFVATILSDSVFVRAHVPTQSCALVGRTQLVGLNSKSSVKQFARITSSCPDIKLSAEEYVLRVSGTKTRAPSVTIQCLDTEDGANVVTSGEVDFAVSVLTIPSHEFAKAVSKMLGDVCVTVDPKSATMLFASEENSETVEVPIELDATECKHAKEYSESFGMAQLTAIAKLSKLAKHIKLSVPENKLHPIQARIELAHEGFVFMLVASKQ